MRTAHGIFLISTLWLLVVATSVSGQDFRRKIYDLQRKGITEVSRSKRDYNTITHVFSSSKRTVNAAEDTSTQILWAKKPYVPNSGMIHDYKYVYTFLHSQQEFSFKRTYDLKNVLWDSVNNVYYKNVGNKDTISAQYEVIGWHPHWMGDAYKYYNYKLLTMISFYSYDIDPNTGSPKNPDVIEQLKTSSLPDTAARYGKKVLISVTSLVKENNSIFLADEYVQDHFIMEILDLLNSRVGKFAGIDLNMEEIDPSKRDNVTHFIKKLNARLTANKYILILDVPYFNNGNVFDYKELKDHVKYFNIMGYDFSGAHSEYPGSISPLHANDTQPSLETSVNDLLNMNVSSDKIILSLGLYGVTWDITNINMGQPATYEESMPYYQVMSTYKTEYNPFYDPFSSSFFFLVNDKDKHKICWYENEVSLQAKFEWIKAKKLKGVGLWALGYEQGAPEIWKEVAGSFGADSLSVIPYTSELSGSYGIVKSVVKYKKMFGLGFLVFTSFIVLGFVLSLRDWQVREVLFQSQSFRVVYYAVFLIFLGIGLKWFWIGDHEWNMWIGSFIGGSFVVVLNMLFSNYRKRLK